MAAVVRTFWNEPAIADPPRRVWRDWVLVGVVVTLCIVEVAVRPDIPLRWLSFAVALGAAPSLLWRRTHPLAAASSGFGAGLGLDVAWLVTGHGPPGLYTMAYVLILAYALVRWGSGRQALIGLSLMLVGGTISTVFDFTGVGDVVGGWLVLTTTVVLGVALRYRGRARSSRLDEVRAREREELARDLHDTVAHHVSAIAIRAQAGLALAPSDPRAAVEALRVIDAEASRTLAEMRTIVRGLRRDEPMNLAPLPRIGDVSALAGPGPGGPVVHVHIDGDPESVPASVSTAAYRLAQESITNARRHARRATRVDVVVHAGPDTVTVDVTDDGEPASGRRDGGYGIAGMLERVERLGGTVTAGPGAGRGWAVHATLPTNGVAG